MKNILLILTALFAFSGSVKSQNTPTNSSKDSNIICVITTAKWCPTCRANGPRVSAEVLPQLSGKTEYSVVVNDLSDDATKAASAEKLSALGISATMEKNNSTGTIYFVRPSTKEIIAKVSVKKPTEEIVSAFQMAYNSVK